MTDTYTLDRKMCTKCLEVKPVSEYTKNGVRDGKQRYSSWCRQCQAQRYRAYHAAHPETYRARYETKRDQILSQNAKWRVENPDRMHEARLRWKSENPDRVLLHRNNRRARGASNAHHPYSRAEIFARWGGNCCYCDNTATDLDHVKPIARGGADAEPNLVPACTPCNSSKGAKSLADWAMTFGPDHD